jgi:hypothetical protein
MCSHRATPRQLTLSAGSDRLEFRSDTTTAKTNMETSNDVGYLSFHRVFAQRNPGDRA